MNSINSTKKGLLVSCILMITSLACFYVLHLPDNGNCQYLILSLFIFGLIWVMTSFKKNTSSYVFKDYFSEGFKYFIVITFIMTIYTFIFQKLNPQILENGINENNELLRQQGDRTMQEINANAAKLRSIFIPMMLMITAIKYLFLGALVSGIIGGFMSQKK